MHAVTSTSVSERALPAPAGPKPMVEATQSTAEIVVLWIFVVAPFVALIAAIPLAWGWGLSALDDDGRRRCIWSPSSASPSVSTAISPTARSRPAVRCASRWPSRAPWRWRAHPRSGWPITAATTRSPTARATRTRRGATAPGWPCCKGLLYAHCGWLLNREITNRARFAPDLLADRGIRVVDRLFRPLVAVSLLAPAVIGGLVTGAWTGALTGFFWAGLVRMALLHHVTWSVNSDLPRRRRTPVRQQGQGDELLAAGDPVLRRELAQLPPRRPDRRPARRPARSDRPLRPAHLAVREGRLGPGRALAQPGPPRRQTRPRVSRIRHFPDAT